MRDLPELKASRIRDTFLTKVPIERTSLWYVESMPSSLGYIVAISGKDVSMYWHHSTWDPGMGSLL